MIRWIFPTHFFLIHSDVRGSVFVRGFNYCSQWTKIVESLRSSDFIIQDPQSFNAHQPINPFHVGHSMCRSPYFSKISINQIFNWYIKKFINSNNIRMAKWSALPPFNVVMLSSIPAIDVTFFIKLNFKKSNLSKFHFHIFSN